MTREERFGLTMRRWGAVDLAMEALSPAERAQVINKYTERKLLSSAECGRAFGLTAARSRQALANAERILMDMLIDGDD